MGVQMNLKNIPSVETIQPFNYFYPGLNNLLVISGNAKLAKTFEGKIMSSKISVNTIKKLPIDNDILHQISNYNKEENAKILCTLPRQLMRELRSRNEGKFWFALAEDESKWYTKKSIISFRQTISKFEIPEHILKSIPQYLRVEGEEIKSLIAFTKTIQAYFRKIDYFLYIREQTQKIN